MRVLLVSNTTELDALQAAISSRGHHVSRVERANAVDSSLDAMLAAIDLIIADIDHAEATNLVSRVTAAAPGIELVMIGTSDHQWSAEVLAQIPRPFAIADVLGHVDEVAAILDGGRFREPLDLVAYDTVFAGNSPQIVSLLRRVRLVARSDAPLWIVGDDGTGRAVVARATHDRSSRRNEPFVACNAAAYADEELSQVLFHGDSAAFRRAASGTVYVDQLSATGPTTQRELMQFLDRRSARATEAPSARLIVGVQPSSTGSQSMFSSELFYRLKVLEVEIPRLNDRTPDLAQIVGRMLDRLANNQAAPAISFETMRLLEHYRFPGNLLELAHALTHAFVLASGGSIETHHLPPSIRQPVAAAAPEASHLDSLDTVAKRFERDYLLRVLRSVDGNRGRAAEILGLSRKGLWGKLKAHGISDEDLEEKLQP